MYPVLAIAQTLRSANEAEVKSMAMSAIETRVFKLLAELATAINMKALISRAAEHSETTLARI